MTSLVREINRQFLESVEVVLDIALRENCVSSSPELFGGEDGKKRYLEKPMQRLSKFGILRSRRGPHGGYILGRAPSEIRLADILAAIATQTEEVDGEGASAPLRTFVLDQVASLTAEWLNQLAEITVQRLLDLADEKQLRPKIPAQSR